MEKNPCLGSSPCVQLSIERFPGLSPKPETLPPKPWEYRTVSRATALATGFLKLFWVAWIGFRV